MVRRYERLTRGESDEHTIAEARHDLLHRLDHIHSGPFYRSRVLNV